METVLYITWQHLYHFVFTMQTPFHPDKCFLVIIVRKYILTCSNKCHKQPQHCWSSLCQCFVSNPFATTACNSSIIQCLIPVHWCDIFCIRVDSLSTNYSSFPSKKASVWAAVPAKQRGHFLHHTGRKAFRCQSQLKSIWLGASPHCAHHTSKQQIR